MRLARERRTRKRQGSQQMRRLARILRGRCGHDLGVVALLIGHTNDACRYTLVWSLKNWNRLKCLKDLSTKRFTDLIRRIWYERLKRPRPLLLKDIRRDVLNAGQHAERRISICGRQSDRAAHGSLGSGCAEAMQAVSISKY